MMERARRRLAASEIPATLFGVTLVGLAGLVFVALPFLRNDGSYVEVTATVVAPFERPTEDGSAYYMRATLESGEEVRVPIPRSVPVRPGQTVVLLSLEGNRLGLTRHRFVRYLDAADKE
jgi:hypothetical protein